MNGMENDRTQSSLHRGRDSQSQMVWIIFEIINNVQLRGVWYAEGFGGGREEIHVEVSQTLSENILEDNRTLHYTYVQNYMPCILIQWYLHDFIEFWFFFFETIEVSNSLTERISSSIDPRCSVLYESTKDTVPILKLNILIFIFHN